MDGHNRTRRQRTIAVPLIFLVVLCFLCALCYSAVPQAAPEPGPVPLLAADCPEHAGEPFSPPADVPAQGLTPACEAANGHGLPTAPPLFLFVLGVALAFAALSAPRRGPGPRPHRPEPVALHGSGLLTLLCVQRV